MKISRLVIKKIINKKWINISLLFGTILLVMLFVCHPLLSDSACNRLLTITFENGVTRDNTYYAMASYIENNIYDITEYEEIIKLLNDNKDYLEQKIGEKVYDGLLYTYIKGGFAKCSFSERNADIVIGAADNFNEHIQITAGENFTEKFDCLISEKVMDELGLSIGEQLKFNLISDKNGNPLVLNICGYIEKKEDTDTYWVKDLNNFKNTVFVSEDTFDNILKDYNYDYVNAESHSIFNYLDFNVNNAEKIYAESLALSENSNYTFAYLDLLKQYMGDAKSIKLVLYALELPCLVLLFIFLCMMNDKIIRSETGEISILLNRGVEKKKIAGIYLLQITYINLCGAVLGTIAGFLTSGLIYECTVSYKVFLYAGISMFVNVLFVLFSLVRVMYKKGEKKKYGTPFVLRYGMDLILIAVSVYLLFQYKKQASVIALDILNGRGVDPFIFLNASLFIFALGLFGIRIFKYITLLIYRIGKKKWKPHIYASFLQIIRTYGKGFLISVFIVMTLANSVYSANMLSTIKKNISLRTEYDMGCDLIITQKFKSYKYRSGNTGKTLEKYVDNNYNIFDELVSAGKIQSAARVIRENDAIATKSSSKCINCQFMAVNTKEFGETAELMPGLNDTHWYNKLNLLAKKINGVIISRTLADKIKADVGDAITVERNNEEELISFEVVAITEAFPGYERYMYSDGIDGVTVEEDGYLIISNYAYIVSEQGIAPYEIWIKGENSDEVLNSVEYISAKSSSDELDDRLNSPVVKVTEVMFKIGFVISALICLAGFLIYRVISVKDREMQLGVFRAMGMSKREINRMLSNELLFGTVFQSVLGIATGYICTKVFAGIIAICYLPNKHVIPLKVYVKPIDSIVLMLCMTMVFAVCIVIFKVFVKKSDITKALKLGEDS